MRSLAFLKLTVTVLTLFQGGHALVALYTEGAMPLHKVTCLPRGHALGYVGCVPCALGCTLSDRLELDLLAA